MSSYSAMLPPPLSSRRRNRVQLPLSPPPSPDASPCGPRRMSLSKAETFHVPSTPPSDNDPVLSIPHLPRRSSTASKTLLALMLRKEEEVVDSIASFDKSFSGSSSSDIDGLDKGYKDIHGRRHRERRTPLDIDGLKREKESHEHASDSGIGSSISSVISHRQSVGLETDFTADRLLLLGVASHKSPTEADHSSIDSDLAVAAKGATTSLENRQGRIHSNTHQPVGPSAITKSISPLYTAQSTRSSLSSFARKKINDLVFQPILREEDFSLFHPLVHSLNDQNRKRTIKCLRDLEKSLIFEPLRLTTSTALFRRFGEFSVQLVLDTYPHLSEPEQRRSTDRPYDNGYFLDLVQQVSRLAAQIRDHLDSGENDEMAPTLEDRVTLEGGMAETGNIAELCRWKDGVPISLRTGEPYEPLAGMKRGASVLDDDAERTMARRKKGALPLELRCPDKTCGKIFTRKCDLAKHEKTHSRPFKCSEPDCKYHELGLPTEKERDRHINDKHSANPHYYHCAYCPFKTKRDSNCKQHMEKKHGWTYDRIKGNGRPRAPSDPSATPLATPQTPAASTPISVDYSSVRGGSTAPQSLLPTPIEAPQDTFNDYHYEPATPVHLGGSLFTPGRTSSVSGVNAYTSPNQQMTVATPYSAISNITEQNHGSNEFEMYGAHEQTFRGPSFGQYAMATPPSPDMKMKIVPNQFTQMPLTPSTSSGHLASRNASVSLTTPITPNNTGLDETISPQLQMVDEFMDFNAPIMVGGMMDPGDIPMNDFSLFGSDGFINHAAQHTDLFDTYLDLDGYEA